MSMDRINADIEGGFLPEFSGLAGGEVMGVEGIEGGKGKKGMKWRSPATREFSRLKRSTRRSKCPKGSRKDTRKHGRNASGCRHSSPGRSGYRKYTRRSAEKKEKSTGRVLMGHTIHKLASKEGQKAAGSLYYEHAGKRVYFKQWSKEMKGMWKA